MSEEKRSCPKCGGNEFYADQHLYANITTIVDGEGNWLRNQCNDVELVSLLECKTPDAISELCTTCEDEVAEDE